LIFCCNAVKAPSSSFESSGALTEPPSGIRLSSGYEGGDSGNTEHPHKEQTSNITVQTIKAFLFISTSSSHYELFQWQYIRTFPFSVIISHLPSSKLVSLGYDSATPRITPLGY